MQNFDWTTGALMLSIIGGLITLFGAVIVYSIEKNRKAKKHKRK